MEPDIVALPLHDEQKYSTQRRAEQVRKAGLIIESDAQARVELAQRAVPSGKVPIPSCLGPGQNPLLLVVARAGDATGPLPLWLRVLQRRRRGRGVVVVDVVAAAAARG